MDGTVELLVLDPEGGLVEGRLQFHVDAHAGASVSRLGETDAPGRYRLELAAGERRIHLHDDSGRRGEVTVDVPADGTVAATVRLRR